MAKSAKRKAAQRAKPVKATKKPLQADKLFADLELVNVRLLNLVTKLEIQSGQAPDQAQLKATVAVGPSADNTIHVDGFLMLEGRPKDAAGDGSILVISIQYQCVYAVRGGTPIDKYRDQSKGLAAPAMLVMWPHFRELVQSLTGRMGIPPFILPMFTVGVPGKGAGKNISFEELTEPSVPGGD